MVGRGADALIPLMIDARSINGPHRGEFQSLAPETCIQQAFILVCSNVICPEKIELKHRTQMQGYRAA